MHRSVSLDSANWWTCCSWGGGARPHCDQLLFIAKDRVVQWPVEDIPDGMSVSPASHNLVVSFSKINTIVEYTTVGQIVRRIKLPLDILHPFHAIELAADRSWLVTHGRKDDEERRVCRVTLPVLPATGQAFRENCTQR